ncbi:MAG: hypothetical protein GWN71_32270, partial [Gammaproteobacteria bacterium]|nr:hypothetical protein [Gammaproteobacteria bacterium]
SIFEARGGFRPNAEVREADIASAKLAGFAEIHAEWLVPLEAEASIEHADADLAGDVSFTLLGAGARA